MRFRGNRHAHASLLGILMTLVSAGIAQTADGGPSRAEAAPRGRAGRVTAAVNRLLAQVDVADEGSRQGYRRDRFNHWVTDDEGCTTRQRVLIDEREDGTVRGCRVTSGAWMSLYDEREITDARRIDIDHMVPLAEAWDSGASAWDDDRREAYANDLGYDDALIAVTASSNRSKSDQDPGEWLPPSEDAYCRYATAWTSVKVRWSLTADEVEIEALREMFRACRTPPPTRVEVVDLS